MADAEARGLSHTRGAAVSGGADEEEGGVGARWQRQASGAAQGRLLQPAGPRGPLRARAVAEASGGLHLRLSLQAAALYRRRFWGYAGAVKLGLGLM